MTGPVVLEAQNLYSDSSVAEHDLGAMTWDTYGNRYRYVKNGASALTTGNLLQEPVENTQFHAMALQANVAIGAYKIPVTLGTTAVTEDLFVDGILYIASGTGIGQQFRIVSHTVAALSSTCTFTVDRPVAIALTTAGSSTVTVRQNPYKGVIVYPTTQTGGAVGVALHAMAANKYGWIQSGGECAVLDDDGASETGNGTTWICPSASVAGSVKLAAANGANRIGFSRVVTSVTVTEFLAHLTID